MGKNTYVLTTRARISAEVLLTDTGNTSSDSSGTFPSKPVQMDSMKSDYGYRWSHQVYSFELILTVQNALHSQMKSRLLINSTSNMWETKINGDL